MDEMYVYCVEIEGHLQKIFRDLEGAKRMVMGLVDRWYRCYCDYEGYEQDWDETTEEVRAWDGDGPCWECGDIATVYRREVL